MTKYLAGVLSVIAVGVLLIAYGLLAPNAQASFDNRGAGVGSFVNDGVLPGSLYGDAAQTMAYPRQAVPVAYAPAPQNADYRVMPAMQTVDAMPVRTVARDAPRRMQPRTVVAKPKRDWKKTAMIIGGTSAAAAGVGGLIGGKKGALIGAAIGGGASTIYETQKGRR
jgi:hypothetical protein